LLHAACFGAFPRQLLILLAASISSGIAASSTAVQPAAASPAQAISGPVTSAVATVIPPAKLSRTPVARPRS